MKSFLLIFTIFQLSFLSARAFICPDAAEISPCSCALKDVINEGTIITCKGPRVLQETINNFNSAFRLANNLGPTDILSIYELTIEDTGLTQLDLTPLMYLDLTYLYLWHNFYLTTIIGPGPLHYGDIHAESLNLDRCYFNDAGLGQALRYFDPVKMERLDLSNNLLEGAQNKELLPGLSNFENLDWLILSGNPLKRLEGAPLRANTKLGLISIDSADLVEIGRDAFLFDEPPAELLNDVLNIYLDFNGGLTTNSFANDTGLERSSRIIELSLKYSTIDAFLQAPFEGFLKARDENSIGFRYTHTLICDNRMKWLKDQKHIFEHRVYYAICSNDNPKTVFTTDLID